eukprot:RCo000144
MPKNYQLGRALARAQKQKRRMRPVSDVHTTEDSGIPSSALVQGMLDPKLSDAPLDDDLFWNAELSKRVTQEELQYEKSRSVVLIDKRKKPAAVTPEQELALFERSKRLGIPHRPPWHRGMSGAEVAAKERDAFLEWRRGLAKLEEDEEVLMTPFEKNLEVWRQLWRVVERSDVVFVILDARHPFMFRNYDLEQYVQSQPCLTGDPKRVVLLLNKADLLTVQQRTEWAKYFKSQGLLFVWFSAEAALQKIKAEKDEETRAQRLAAAAERELPDAALRGPHWKPPVGGSGPSSTAARHNRGSATQGRNEGDSKEEKEEGDDEDEAEDEDDDDTEEQEGRGNAAAGGGAGSEDVARIFTPEDILQYLNTYAKALVTRAASIQRERGAGKADGEEVPEPQGIIVGMVGYPNVGKSSTLNALVGCKRVTVSSTPGKTKHLQTIVLSPLVTLCDCPGLVFPSFVGTREEMLCDGILSLDHMKDCVAPTALMMTRIPTSVFEMAYTLNLDWEHDEDYSQSPAELLLNQYARLKGYRTEHNKPNRTKAARELLKDYVNGKLVYVHPPPGLTAEAWKSLSEAAETAEKAKQRQKPRGEGEDDDEEEEEEEEAEDD